MRAEFGGQGRVESATIPAGLIGEDVLEPTERKQRTRSVNKSSICLCGSNSGK